MATDNCPNCGAPSKAGDAFCAKCGRALPTASGARSARPKGGAGMRAVLLLLVGAAFGAVLVVGVVLATQHTDDQPNATPLVSDKLVGYVRAHGNPNDVTAEQACPLLPALSAIVQAPATYRGQCVYAAGYVQTDATTPVVEMTLPAADTATAADQNFAVRYLASGDLVHSSRAARPIPSGQSVGQVWLRFVSDQDRQHFWQKADTAAAVGLLGTLDGLWQDAPLIDVAAIYFQQDQ